MGWKLAGWVCRVFLGNMLNKARWTDCAIVDDVIVIQNVRGAEHYHFGLEVSTLTWVAVVVVAVVAEMAVMVATFGVSKHFFPTDHVCTCTWSRSHVCRCYFAKIHGCNSELDFFQPSNVPSTGMYNMYILTYQGKLHPQSLVVLLPWRESSELLVRICWSSS